MISREAARLKAQECVALEAIPTDLQWPVVELLLRFPDAKEISKSELIREFLRHEEVEKLMNLRQDQLALVFRCSSSLVQRVVHDFRHGKTTVHPGRPCLLSDENMRLLEAWLRERTESKSWITMREFKLKVVDLLEDQGIENYPTSQFYRDLLQRIDNHNYTVTLAQPVEEERFALTREAILQHFLNLQQLHVQNFDPDLILNIDETGFGASRAHRMKPVKVIVFKGNATRPCLAYETERVFVSAIAAITASGEALKPALIVRRATLDQDFDDLPVGKDLVVYQTEKAFVTRQVFTHYLREVVVSYVERQRAAKDDKDAKALLIFDGHASHLDGMLRAVCASLNIEILCLPPHSSHILQPLDRLYFSRVKQMYSQSSVGSGLSPVSKALLRVVTAFESAQSRYMICMSWRMAGLRPVVAEREVTAILPDPDLLEGETSLEHAEAQPHRARGARNQQAQWGILTEDERLILEAGQCPLCFAELPEGWKFT